MTEQFETKEMVKEGEKFTTFKKEIIKNRDTFVGGFNTPEALEKRFYLKKSSMVIKSISKEIFFPGQKDLEHVVHGFELSPDGIARGKEIQTNEEQDKKREDIINQLKEVDNSKLEKLGIRFNVETIGIAEVNVRITLSTEELEKQTLERVENHMRDNKKNYKTEIDNIIKHNKNIIALIDKRDRGEFKKDGAMDISESIAKENEAINTIIRSC